MFRRTAILFILLGIADAMLSFHEFLKYSGRSNWLDFVSTDADSACLDNSSRDIADLMSAVRKNPWDATSRIALSGLEEAKGNTTEAKRLLIQAAQQDRTKAPRAALANFYYRENDKINFLFWANSYRSWTHQEEEELFRLALQQDKNPEIILHEFPDLQCDELQALIDLMTTNNLDADLLILKMINRCKDSKSLLYVTHLVSEFLLDDKPFKAELIWRMLDKANSAAASAALELRQAVNNEGFGWRTNYNPLIALHKSYNNGLQLSISGPIADGTVLLYRPVLLMRSGWYKIAIDGRCTPSCNGTLYWELIEMSSGKRLDREQREIPGTDWQNTVFYVEENKNTVVAALYYKRPSGEVPFAGSLDIHPSDCAWKAITPAPSQVCQPIDR